MIIDTFVAWTGSKSFQLLLLLQGLSLLRTRRHDERLVNQLLQMRINEKKSFGVGSFTLKVLEFLFVTVGFAWLCLFICDVYVELSFSDFCLHVWGKSNVTVTAKSGDKASSYGSISTVDRFLLVNFHMI